MFVATKNHWRQVEADRIERKHPLTLEAAISAHQADEMQTMNHQFILPRSLHGTYTVDCHAAGMVLDMSGLKCFGAGAGEEVVLVTKP